MSKTILVKNQFLLLSLVVVLFFVFLIMIIITTKSNLLTDPAPNESSGGAVYRTETGDEVFYDPTLVSQEDIEKMIEEQKKNVED